MRLPRTLLRPAKNAVQWTFESLWALGFTVLGRFSRPAAERWSSPGGQQVVVLAPHPDDEVCGCGGTLLLHRRRGDTVHVVYITDGRRSTAYGLGSQEMARRRRAEAESAATALGVDQLHWLGLPEGEWSPPDLVPHLVALFDRHAPHLIYAPSFIDFHPEHHKVALTLAQVLDPGPLPRAQPWVRIYQLQVPLTWVLTNLVAETSQVMSQSQHALQVYTTQLGAILPSLRLKRYTACLFGLKRQGEEFWQVKPQVYSRLHLPPSTPPRRGTFRSFRHYAWSDPLAYGTGLGERRNQVRLVDPT